MSELLQHSFIIFEEHSNVAHLIKKHYNSSIWLHPERGSYPLNEYLSIFNNFYLGHQYLHF